MDLAALRHRLGVTPAEAIPVPALSDDAMDLVRSALVPSAVLVGIQHGSDPGILLTKRAPHLVHHPGQVSFPGGRIDPGDASAEAAALREAAEEIGLDASYVELAGRLPDYATGTGFRISPILALLPSGLTFRPHEAEVEEIFTLPLDVLLDPHAPQRQRTEFRGRMREFWVWPHPTHYIWGATAAILVNLSHRLRAVAA